MHKLRDTISDLVRHVAGAVDRRKDKTVVLVVRPKQLPLRIQPGSMLSHYLDRHRRNANEAGSTGFRQFDFDPSGIGYESDLETVTRPESRSMSRHFSARISPRLQPEAAANVINA